MKKLIDFFKRHNFLRNLLYISIASFLLIVGVLWWLNIYTHHGESEIVPNIKNLKMESAVKLLENKGLNYEVVDSVYKKGFPPGNVVEQDPQPGSFVKRDRKIYIVINARSVQMLPLPSASDISLRQSKSILEGSGFKVTEIEYKPSAYKDLVLSVQYKGREVFAGDRIPAESALVLWVGSGSLEEIVEELDTLSSEDIIGESSLEEEIVF